jgi:hypothetical protein
MLIRFGNTSGGVAAFDVFEVVSATPASAKGDGGVPIIGASLVQLRGMPFGSGVLVKEGVDSILARVNELRTKVIQAQTAAAAGKVVDFDLMEAFGTSAPSRLA